MENKEELIKLYESKIDEIYGNTINNSSYTDKIKCLEDELIQILTDQQKEQLQKINEYKQQQNEEIYKNIFVSAFSLATKLFVEGINKN